jgi:D-alanyl-D-alanine carboxypeptidase
MKLHFLFRAVTLFSVKHALGSYDSALDESLQKVLDRAAFFTGSALSLGVALPTRTVSLSSGKRQSGSDSQEHVLPSDSFAMGSTAKMYTAAAILRLVDAGRIGLDDKALPLLDTIWTRLNGTSIANVFGQQMREVTVRQLLQMRSGIPDFDTMASRGYQFQHPDQDLGPVESMSFITQGRTFDCQPGTCGSYSSSNYELLGLILAQEAGSASWDNYTQALNLPKDVLATMPNTEFALHGPCSKYTSIHAYSFEKSPPVDVFNMSCTNGWTCGNLMSNAVDAAVFVRALLGKEEAVLKKESQREMVKFSPLTQGWSTGLQYGLGLMDMSAFVGKNASTFIGHGGDTYGFNAMTGYADDHDFGLSVVANTENTLLTRRVLEESYDSIVKAIVGQRKGNIIV